MRSASYDKKQVRCPNASFLGYGKGTARVGYWVSWKTPGDDVTHLGRMVGRVAYAPTDGLDVPAVRGWAVVLTLGMEGTSAFFRWVNPAWITQSHPHTADIARFHAWFSADTLPDAETCGYLSQYGSLSANQQPDQPSWDFAAKLARGLEAKSKGTRP